MASLAICRGATDYYTLRQVIHDFEKGEKVYQTVSACNQAAGSSSFYPTQEKEIKIPTLMVRPDAIVSDV